MGEQLQGLDIATLLVVHQMLALILAVVILAGAIHTKGRFGLWFWFGSFATTAFFQLLWDNGPISESPVTAVLMGQYGVLLNVTFIALAVKSYLGKPLRWKLIGGIALSTAGTLLLLSRFVLESTLSLPLTLAVAAGLISVTLSNLLQAYRRERGFALGFSTFIIALLLGRLLLRGLIAISSTDDGAALAVNSTALLIFIAALVMQGFAILMLINDNLQKKCWPWPNTTSSPAFSTGVAWQTVSNVFWIGRTGAAHRR